MQTPAVHYDNTRAFVDSIAHDAQFVAMDANAQASVAAAAVALWEGDGIGAQSLAAPSGYQVLSLQTDKEWLWLLVPGTTTPPGHAILVVRESADRDLLLEAPHVPYDVNTAEQAAELFDLVRARGLLLAGANRCISAVPAPCATVSGVCNPTYNPDSDVTVATTNAFFAIHQSLTGEDESLITLQLHANPNPKDNGNVLLSDGTRKTASPGALVNSFAHALGKAGILDVRTCNGANGHLAPQAACGEANVEGRLSNGAANVCTPNHDTSRDKFVHMEQSTHALRRDFADWVRRVAHAIRQVT